MKISASNLKNLDYKQLAADHGEKLVVGVIVLATLLVLFKTPWSPVPDDPADVTAAAQEAEEKIKASAWPGPDPTKKVFDNTPDLRKDAETMMAAINPSEFELAQPMFHSLVQQNRASEEPKWYAVNDPLADFARVVVAVAPAAKPEAPKAAEKKPAADASIPDEFKAREGGGRARGDDDGRSSRRRAGIGGLFGFGSRRDEENRIGAAPLGNDMQAQKQAAIQNMDGRGQRFISIRGVFPLKEQLDAVKKALNLATTQEAQRFLNIVDFEIERQTAIQGADPWSGPWEKLDLRTAMDTLNQAVDFDVDPVDPGVLHQVFTMPLPYRASGVWSENISHPGVQNFRLSQAELDRQIELNQRILDDAAKKQEEFRKQQTAVETKGFAGVQYDMRGLRGQYAQGLGEVGEELKQDLIADKIDNADDAVEKIRKQLEQQVTAAGQVLLFRYLDFAVVPHNAYRYRIRLIAANPNYGRNLAEVVTPEVAAEPTRTMPWSEPTEPVYVPGDAKYFLVRAGQADPGTAGGSAQIDFYRWLPDFGTMINEQLQLNVGDFLGGVLPRVHVLDVAHSTFEQKKVNALTNDVLVDIATSPSLPRDPKLHADLELANASGRSLPIPDEMLVLDETGELRKLDSASGKEDQAMAAKRFELERQPWKWLIDETAEAEKSRLDPNAPPGEDDGFGRRRSPNRRRS